MNDVEEILSRLQKMERAIELIKQRMPDREMFLTSEERILLDESYEGERQGRLVKSEDVRRQLGL